jgi:hypothetical protein
MIPHARPFAMLNVSGIMTKVKKAGKAVHGVLPRYLRDG